MACDLVLFGGTGDPVWRQLQPGLLPASRHGTQTAGNRIIRVTDHDLTDEPCCSRLRPRWDSVDRDKRQTAGEFSRVADLLHPVLHEAQAFHIGPCLGKPLAQDSISRRYDAAPFAPCGDAQGQTAWMSFSSFTASAAKLRIPSASFSVAMASSFSA